MNNDDILLALDGTILDKEVYEKLFNEINTYTELPAMLELAAYEVVRSSFDNLKEHSISYHVAGMINIMSGVKKALKHLEDEVKILDINLEDEMDMTEYQRYLQVKKTLNKFI